jgi:hypothetical protein
MLRNRHVRNLIAIVLGGCAGLSFTVSVLPVMLQLGNVGGQLQLTRALVPLWPWAALVWAVGGLGCARLAAPLPAALLLGLVGAATGILLVVFGPGFAPLPGIFGLVSGLVYGGLGGLILGRVLAPSSEGEAT